MILLLFRLSVFLVFASCLILIPYFLTLLVQSEKKKQIEKSKQTKPTSQPRPSRTLESLFDDEDMLDSFFADEGVSEYTYKKGTPKVEQMFSLIEKRHRNIIQEKEHLSLESAHRLTQTFQSDFKQYKNLYLQMKDKASVEEEALQSLQMLNEELDAFENEIEKKKKTALERQGIIIEKRGK